MVALEKAVIVTLALWSNDARVCVVKKADAKEVTINENINDAASCTIANIDK